MRKTIIGVMGPGEHASEQDKHNAFELGRLVAERGWLLLTGGRDSGVMAAANRGAHSAGGLTIGILPSSDGREAAAEVDIVICTDMGSARNNINVLSSAVVVACGMGAGTASEAALALKAKKPLVLLGATAAACGFLSEIGGTLVTTVETPAQAVERISALLDA